MKHEIRFTIELNDTDSTLLDHMMEQDGITLDSFAKNEVSGKLDRLLITRKREIGSIVAAEGLIDEVLLAGSAKMAEAHKSPW